MAEFQPLDKRNHTSTGKSCVIGFGGGWNVA